MPSQINGWATPRPYEHCAPQRFDLTIEANIAMRAKLRAENITFQAYITGLIEADLARTGSEAV